SVIVSTISCSTLCSLLLFIGLGINKPYSPPNLRLSGYFVNYYPSGSSGAASTNLYPQGDTAFPLASDGVVASPAMLNATKPALVKLFTIPADIAATGISITNFLP